MKGGGDPAKAGSLFYYRFIIRIQTFKRHTVPFFICKMDNLSLSLCANFIVENYIKKTPDFI